MLTLFLKPSNKKPKDKSTKDCYNAESTNSLPNSNKKSMFSKLTECPETKDSITK